MNVRISVHSRGTPAEGAFGEADFEVVDGRRPHQSVFHFVDPRDFAKVDLLRHPLANVAQEAEREDFAQVVEEGNRSGGLRVRINVNHGHLTHGDARKIIVGEVQIKDPANLPIVRALVLAWLILLDDEHLAQLLAASGLRIAEVFGVISGRVGRVVDRWVAHARSDQNLAIDVGDAEARDLANVFVVEVDRDANFGRNARLGDHRCRHDAEKEEESSHRDRHARSAPGSTDEPLGPLNFCAVVRRRASR
mmetsp:Transcript_182/g.488  ORF Transcript_182/g.488 Transcript_182/m.488 type:complete len:250 (-) Transcript_182:8-757(-)